MIPLHDGVLIFLWYIANQETFRTIAERFNVTESSAYRVINKVVEILFSKQNEFIKWPEFNEYKRISEEFKVKKGLNGVIGAIDILHIPIKRPQQDSQNYENRKGCYSITLQGTVDCRKMFIDVSCAEPGSLHEAQVLKKSSLYATANSDNNFFKKYFLLGNSAYPALHWLVPPYRDNGNLSNKQIRFNYLHSSTRNIVKNAFGLMIGRFRRIRKFDNNKIDFIAKCTIVICMLHNICIFHDDLMEDYLEDEDGLDEENGIVENEELEDTGNKRELLLNSLL